MRELGEGRPRRLSVARARKKAGDAREGLSSMGDGRRGFGVMRGVCGRKKLKGGGELSMNCSEMELAGENGNGGCFACSRCKWTEEGEWKGRGSAGKQNTR